MVRIDPAIDPQTLWDLEDANKRITALCKAVQERDRLRNEVTALYDLVKKFDPARNGNLRGWLAAYCWRRLLDRLRKRDQFGIGSRSAAHPRRVPLPIMLPARDLPDHLAIGDAIAACARSLGGKRRREVFALIRRGLTHVQAATELGVSPSAVSRIMSDIFAQLRDEFRGREDCFVDAPRVCQGEPS
jgi:DNA-directed RNA polymerase specialized sigma24 family protein